MQFSHYSTSHHQSHNISMDEGKGARILLLYDWKMSQCIAFSDVHKDLTIHCQM